MLSAILILLAMPFTDLSRSRGLQFRPLNKIVFYIFVANFFILMVLGAKHVESPFIELGQICTVLYFAHFLVIVPLISILENSFADLASFTVKLFYPLMNLALRSNFYGVAFGLLLVMLAIKNNPYYAIGLVLLLILGLAMLFIVIGINLDYLSYTDVPMTGVKCPTCAANGQEVWVIPGRNCHYCGTPC
jgi:ubiquinol-cytochrome c reductase cytochrome b subunit